MKMTDYYEINIKDVFARNFPNDKAFNDLTKVEFTKRIRLFDSMTYKQLGKQGVDNLGIEQCEGLIRYNPAVQRYPCIGGYTLTAKGISKIYKNTKERKVST